MLHPEMRLPLSSQQIQNNILNIYIVQASSIVKGVLKGNFAPSFLAMTRH
jgi:hypothetical protein